MATITIAVLHDIRIIEALGRIDSDAAPDFGTALDDVLNDGHAKLVLDLSGIEYISSAGLREIVRAFKLARAAGGDLRIANPSNPAMTVLELAGLDTALSIFPTRTAAAQSYD
ncbi:MAG: STAS domain-containing protein [Anaerolineae bacterium]|nr:STAS domain-containing protein [Anaerolineae bacterium]